MKQITVLPSGDTVTVEGLSDHYRGVLLANEMATSHFKEIITGDVERHNINLKEVQIMISAKLMQLVRELQQIQALAANVGKVDTAGLQRIVDELVVIMNEAGK